MIYSMTGFGRAESSENGTTVTVEVHSLNGRFLDVRSKLPRNLYQYESALRKIAQEYVSRGKVTVSVTLMRESARADSVGIDFPLTDKYVEIAKDIAARYDVDSNMDARTLMSLPEVFVWSETNGDDNVELWEVTQETARKALEIHRSMRGDEGKAIGSDIRERLETIKSHLGHIEKRGP